MSNNVTIDYYKVLQCDRSATTEEIKKSYQRLLLSSHPDKTDSQDGDEIFLQVQEAWTVLKDSQTRKQYDAMISCHENSELLLYDTIHLSDMTLDCSGNFYTYSCRCGGTYTLRTEGCMEAVVVIGCDECSFSIQINK